MSLQTIYHELRVLPPVAPPDEAASRQRMFERLIEILNEPGLLPSQRPVQALITLFSQAMKQRVITLNCEQTDVPVVTFAVGFRRSRRQVIPLIVLPPTYLEQIRAEPLHALGGVVFTASQARDYLCQKLSQQVSLRRARAFEAEFLRQMQPQHTREDLPWELNSYQQSILQEYPMGLASLSPELVYPTPPLTLLGLMPEGENGH